MTGKTGKPIAILLGLIASAISVPLVLGFLGWLHPAFDSMAHFRIHLAVLLAATGLILLFVRGWRVNGAIAVALGCAAFIATTGLGGRAAALADDGQDAPRYRLLQLNLRFDNPDPQSVLSLIDGAAPDVITLEEVSRMWVAQLAATEEAYPHRIICPHGSRIGGVAVLSRRPFAAPPRCHDRGSLALATVDFDGQAVDIAALHLAWPWPFEQGWQVENLGPSLARLGDRALLAGDFNATPWSMTVRRVAAAGGLTLTRWVGPTWLDRRAPASLRPYVGLPIDHVMVKGGILAGAPRRLSAVGSDHLPVLTEFSLLPDADSQMAGMP